MKRYVRDTEVDPWFLSFQGQIRRQFTTDDSQFIVERHLACIRPVLQLPSVTARVQSFYSHTGDVLVRLRLVHQHLPSATQNARSEREANVEAVVRILSRVLEHREAFAVHPFAATSLVPTIGARLSAQLAEAVRRDLVRRSSEIRNSSLHRTAAPDTEVPPHRSGNVQLQ